MGQWESKHRSCPIARSSLAPPPCDQREERSTPRKGRRTLVRNARVNFVSESRAVRAEARTVGCTEASAESNTLRSFQDRCVASHVAGVAVAIVALVDEERAEGRCVNDPEVDLVEPGEEEALVQLADRVADVVQLGV